ncbi:hypothetical protein V5O48_018970, partial [Marasmius crinis-equi]
MPRTRIMNPNANNLTSVRAFRIPASAFPATVAVSTVSPTKSRPDARVPLVEHRFENITLQPYVHDVDVSYRSSSYRIFFQRHRHLPKNQNISMPIQGDVLVMRLGKLHPGSVVNIQGADIALVHELII